MNTQQVLDAIKEDVDGKHWFVYGTTPRGGCDYWAPISLQSDSRVMGKLCNFGEMASIPAEEYMALRQHPLKKVGIFEFARVDEPWEKIAYCNTNAAAAGHLWDQQEKENAALRLRVEKLTKLAEQAYCEGYRQAMISPSQRSSIQAWGESDARAALAEIEKENARG